MALILAIQPDSTQASTLHDALRSCANAEVVIVDSAEAALAAIDRQKPDLILLHAFISPGDEARLVRRLRSLSNAGRLQTLTIPPLRSASGGPRQRRRRLFGVLSRGWAEPGTGGCDPRLFAEEVGGYLSLAQAAS